MTDAAISADRRSSTAQRSGGRGRSERTGTELDKFLLNWVRLAIPAIAVGAWYAIWAIHLPPPGPAGRWIALGLAAVFGAQNMIHSQFRDGRQQ